jgi:hypothetical protein
MSIFVMVFILHSYGSGAEISACIYEFMGVQTGCGGKKYAVF